MNARTAKKQRAKLRAAYTRRLKRQLGHHDRHWANVADELLPLRRLNRRNMLRAFDGALKSLVPDPVVSLTLGDGRPFLSRLP